MPDEELEKIKNLPLDEYSDFVFKVTVLTATELGAKYFESETPKVYIAGYKGTEG
jgi:hypothetical protein